MADLLGPFKERVKRLVELRTERDEKKEALKTAEKNYRDFEAELWDDLEETGIKGSIAFDFGGELGEIRIHSNETFYGRIIDEEKALEYLENAGLVDSHTEQKFAAKRLNELVRQWREDEATFPEGIDFRAQRYITISQLDD